MEIVYSYQPILFYMFFLEIMILEEREERKEQKETTIFDRRLSFLFGELNGLDAIGFSFATCCKAKLLLRNN